MGQGLTLSEPSKENLPWLAWIQSSTFIHILSCLLGKVRRWDQGVNSPDWSVESALSYMDEHDISACVLSAPSLANNATGQEARDIARRANEVLAEIVSDRPSRFGAVATLPGSNADGAIAEIGYAFDTLKMDGSNRRSAFYGAHP